MEQKIEIVTSDWLINQIKKNYPKSKQRGFSKDSGLDYGMINRHCNGAKEIKYYHKLLYWLWFQYLNNF